MPIEKILVVDDEKLVRDFLVETLTRKNYDVQSAESGQKVISILKEKQYDLVISDMKMEGMTGLDVLRKVKEISPSTLVIIITAYGSVDNAVEATRLGAFNYLIKPFTPDTIETVIEKAKEHIGLLEENSYLRQQIFITGGKADSEVVGTGPLMKKILSEAEQIAKSNASVMITGESGTGKEVIAQLIHHHSQRADRPFIKVNCAAVPETLIESEFFGHEKGAFTGASATHRGRFELASTGSLLLDEITEVPLGLQAKLLRAIQEQEFERVGGTRPIKVDVRIVATSNRDPQTAILEKKLREDLYYRLNVVPIHLPPLRDRREDILPLAQFFLSKLCKENHKEKIKLSRDAEKLLLNYSWPGNVRELANVIERAVVLNSSGTIETADIYIPKGQQAFEKEKTQPIEIGNMTLQEMEKKLILETLVKMNNNRTKTAEMLDISVRTLRNKLNEYKLT